MQPRIAKSASDFAAIHMASLDEASEVKRQKTIVESDDEEMEDAPAAAAPKDNRAQPLPGQQQEFSPELLRL